MNEHEEVRNSISSWVASAESQQPILLISHSKKLREELCEFAKKSAGDKNPDAMSIVGENNRIRVQDIALLRSQLANTSSKRVVAIPCAEDLLPEAANALLKTLEEPTKNTRFLLCAPSKRSVLPTIRSRCNILSVNALVQPETDFSLEASLKKLSDMRPAEPFQEEELLEISRIVHHMALERGVTPALLKVSLRLKDYYKTASFSGGNTKLAADILLASLANLRNTVGNGRI